MINKTPRIDQLYLNGESYYRISDSDSMRPFFMSIVSDSNHWMFISSNGGLTAGRKNSEFALFPYYTDDKITEAFDTTGCKTIILVNHNGGPEVWEPFSCRDAGKYDITRNLYKNSVGNKILFEEINNDLSLCFRYEWCSTKMFGFLRKASLVNGSDSKLKIDMVDGIQNIMPYGVPSDVQNASSNLVNAYKRAELHKNTGLGIYALSAIIVDKAEPCEALKANVVWSSGLDVVNYLLSSLQLDNFRQGQSLTHEDDIKGERGAYFMNSMFDLNAGEKKEWYIVADVNQSHSKVYELIYKIKSSDQLINDVVENVEDGTRTLISLNASADALQCTADSLRDTRHFANVLFNNMRGGIFDDNYNIEKWDFEKYLSHANPTVLENNRSFVKGLPEKFTLHNLQSLLAESSDDDFKRLATEYLPLKFSRRHGDPSRPWNRFSINMIDENDGSKLLDYEGNWRDIFQNWEAMVHAFPGFIDGMIFRFLNASTFDGYNPYRITKGGFDWEVIEPDDPWSYIGYWGDHQIIYMLKFLEFSEKHQPGKLYRYFQEDQFVYANVPYKIKPYEEIVLNPKDTILFDHDQDLAIRESVGKMGADGALLQNEEGDIHRVNFIEKILASVLAKMSNFVPGAGIWMNTQRPEWNDANNALVGNGVSMVTLYYMRRFFSFFDDLLKGTDIEHISLSNELMDFYKQLRKVLEENQDVLSAQLSDESRRAMLDQLGEAASDYRQHIYAKSFWGKKRTVSMDGLRRFFELGLKYIDHTIAENKRQDGLYHAYNLLAFEKNKLNISYLSEMLEGQVAVLSSGVLSSEEVLSLLDAQKSSALFREDQYSYLLYPRKELPGFLEKNIIPEELSNNSKLISALVEDGDRSIVEKDVFGQIHFNGNFRNLGDLRAALNKLKGSKYESLAEIEAELMDDVFEAVFNHKAFTGRSGTFYGYEGLGSIYWHMVSKLLLAVQECCVRAIKNKASSELVGRLLDHFYEINEGIGVHKSPELYGAFPIDPYSHTPWHKGAQQPGMTGQVKEDILSRFGELGVFVDNGSLIFYPCLLRKSEFLAEQKLFKYVDFTGATGEILLEANSLAFSYCQVPVIYKISDQSQIRVVFADGSDSISTSNALSVSESKMIFDRNGNIKCIEVDIPKEILK